MASPVLMPKQGQSVESCIITEWFKQKGDAVKKGDILFAYETDKASFEEEAKEEGILLEIFYNNGDEVPVLTNVATIGKEGESVDDLRPSGEATKEEAPQAEDTASAVIEEPQLSPPTSEIIITPSGEIKISPRAKKIAEQKRIPITGIQGTGPEGRIIERDIIRAEQQGMAMTTEAYTQAGLEFGGITEGHGVGGRAMVTDIQNAATSSGNDFELKKLSNIRKIIAQGMLKSLQNSAQLTHHLGADARNILNFRKTVKVKKEESNIPDITLNDIICYCVINTLKQHPDLNSHFLGEQIKEFKRIHLGIAVDTPRGLMVPALRNTDTMNLETLSDNLKALAENAKGGSIDPELISPEAASFTVSNLGGFGIELFTPVLNLPQVGILGVNTITQRPADIGGGVIGFVPYLGLSLTYDHRAVDGAPASRFLQTLKKEIENFSYTL